VFTTTWVCTKQNNQVDAVWFGWKRPESSPFNSETPGDGLVWKTSSAPIKFPRGGTWRDYVLAPRLEVSCGEAPYLANRYDAVSGAMIPISDRIGLLDRKLRVITENAGADDPQIWLHWAKRAVQCTYGFDWQGDNVLLARENILATVVETFTHVFCGGASSDICGFRCYPPQPRDGIGLDIPDEEDDDCAPLSHLYLAELAEIVSWNIWQMDGLKCVAPMSCRPVRLCYGTADGRIVETTSDCPGCAKGDNYRHNGIYCRVMDWSTGRSARFIDMKGNRA
jgi:hypothetical protein